jgi:hypothetical protein
MTRKDLDSGFWKLTEDAVFDLQPKLDLRYVRIRLTAHQIARLRALAYRDCPKRTLPPLPSLQQSAIVNRGVDGGSGGMRLVFDVIGGDIGKRSAGLIRAGGTDRMLWRAA